MYDRLLGAGAKVDTPDAHGHTPLLIAYHYYTTKDAFLLRVRTKPWSPSRQWRVMTITTSWALGALRSPRLPLPALSLRPMVDGWHSLHGLHALVEHDTHVQSEASEAAMGCQCLWPCSCRWGRHTSSSSSSSSSYSCRWHSHIGHEASTGDGERRGGRPFCSGQSQRSRGDSRERGCGWH